MLIFLQIANIQSFLKTTPQVGSSTWGETFQSLGCVLLVVGRHVRQRQNQIRRVAVADNGESILRRQRFNDGSSRMLDNIQQG